jgi:hypothetical protein
LCQWRAWQTSTVVSRDGVCPKQYARKLAGKIKNEFSGYLCEDFAKMPEKPLFFVRLVGIVRLTAAPQRGIFRLTFVR